MKKILIVEDEPDLARLIAISFQNENWSTCVAANGKIALDKLKEFKPHVIISDISMPEMSGMQLLECLFGQKSETPLIFMTGFRDVENMKKAWSLCAFDFLDKPFNYRTMIQCAENAYKYGREYVRSARSRFLKTQKAA